MQIRPFTPTDAPALKQLLQHIWGDDARSLEYYRFGPDSAPDNPRFFRTLIAEDGGRPIGFGSAWINLFHPHALYVSVHVHPVWRGQGIGSRLLDALDAVNDRRLPLQGCTWESSVDGLRFLERHGFQEARRTHDTLLHVADVDVDAFRHFDQRCADGGYRLASLAELSALPAHEEKLAALLAEGYTATHGINPPRPMELQGWIDLLHSDPLDQEASFVALHGEEYVAFSEAHADEEDWLALGWNGVTEGHRQHERDLILAITLRQIIHVSAQGATVIQGEFDSTSPWSMTQMGAFPFRPAPCWLTFARPARSAV